jgi:hypothetical protein
MKQTISTTPRQWFWRGFLVGVLLIATLNAVSYFVRSEHFGNLLGTTPEHRQALGFPFEIWESGNHYGGFFVDYRMLFLNGTVAAAVGLACGLTVLGFQDPLTRMVRDLETPREASPGGRMQISLGGLMLAILAAAILATIARHAVARRPMALAMIYLLGPWVLILIAFLPLRITWQARVMILVPAAGLMMGGAIWIGGSLEPSLEFDRILLAISVCWIPQTVIAALGLTAWLLLSYARAGGRDRAR